MSKFLIDIFIELKLKFKIEYLAFKALNEHIQAFI